MKKITHIIIVALMVSFATADTKERGVHFTDPIKGILLSGVKEGRNIKKNVVFLTDKGVVYAADFAVISDDDKTITFRGKPMISDGSSRWYSEGPDEWVRINSVGTVTKSDGKWNMRQVEIQRRKN